MAYAHESARSELSDPSTGISSVATGPSDREDNMRGCTYGDRTCQACIACPCGQDHADR
jgi:hypothetical protein